MRHRTCAHCGGPLRTKNAHKCCSVTCSDRATNVIRSARPTGGRNPDKRRASYRAKNHRRRAALRLADVTAEYERKLRAKAKRCPLCQVRMADQPYLPASKELDHIIPLGVGGTHTIGNVRIICRACNLARPKDGSDYTGPVTLWAQDPKVVPIRPVPGVCACGTRKVNSRCYSCRPTRPRGKPNRQADGRRAAELRAQGWSWTDIAASLGFCTGSNAGTAARKYGDPSVIARWPADDPGCQDCGAELPRGVVGRPRKYCHACRPGEGQKKVAA